MSCSNRVLSRITTEQEERISTLLCSEEWDHDGKGQTSLRPFNLCWADQPAADADLRRVVFVGVRTLLKGENGFAHLANGEEVLQERVEVAGVGDVGQSDGYPRIRGDAGFPSRIRVCKARG